MHHFFTRFLCNQFVRCSSWKSWCYFESIYDHCCLSEFAGFRPCLFGPACESMISHLIYSDRKSLQHIWWKPATCHAEKIQRARASQKISEIRSVQSDSGGKGLKTSDTSKNHRRHHEKSRHWIMASSSPVISDAFKDSEMRACWRLLHTGQPCCGVGGCSDVHRSFRDIGDPVNEFDWNHSGRAMGSSYFGFIWHWTNVARSKFLNLLQFHLQGQFAHVQWDGSPSMLWLPRFRVQLFWKASSYRTETYEA